MTKSLAGTATISGHLGQSRKIAPDSRDRNLLAPRAPALAVKNFADDVDHRLWLIELDIFRAIAGGDLFSVRRQSEPASPRKARLLLVFDPLRRFRGLCLQMAYSMIAGDNDANRSGAK